MKSKQKGYNKRKSIFFPKGVRTRFPKDVLDTESSVTPNEGLIPSNAVSRPIKRHHQDYFEDLVIETPANSLSIPDADGEDGSAMLLRAIKPPDQAHHLDDITEKDNASPLGQYNMKEGNLIVEKSRLMDLINEFSRSHYDTDKCKSLCLDIVDIQPWGCFSSVILTCTSCGKRSLRARLFKEVTTTTSSKRGRKAAEGNLRLALICQDMAIGPTETQLLFAAVGIKAGSLTSMQRNAVKAADITEGVTRRDMQKWIDHARDILKDRGAKNPDQISVQFDALYHSMSRANAQCPGQGAAQATGTCAETVTPKKKIIAFHHVNKVCLKGSREKVKGKKVICGSRTSQMNHGCTATQPRGQAIREYDMAEHIAQDLHAEGVAATNVTSDSDGKGRDAFIDVNKQNNQDLPPVKWHKDPSHLSRNMKKKILARSFAGNSFGTKENGQKWNYKEKLDCKKALSLDVPRRVSHTLSEMRTYWKGDIDKMKKNVSKVTGYMMKCYAGDHSSCQSAPLAKLTGCSGPSKLRCWFYTSHTMRACGITRLQLTEKNSIFLQSVIEMKLSPSALNYVARGETTSKCEATNRAINKSLPKNRLFSRTSKGRVSSAIGRINNNFEDFTKMKFTAMNVPMPEDSPAYSVIQKYQHKRDLTVKSQQKKGAQKRKHVHIAQKTLEYFEERKKITNESDYMKYQLDTAQSAGTSALDELITSEPEPSTSYGNMNMIVNKAVSSTMHLHQTLDHVYAKTVNILAAKRRSQRVRKLAAQSKTQRQNIARAKGSEETLHLRHDHSYGALE